MTDEPSRDGNAKPTDPTKPRIEPDQPTPNRDKKRQPPTIDLKADQPKAAAPEPPAAAKEAAAARSDTPKSDTKPLEPVIGSLKAEPTKIEPLKTDARAVGGGAMIGAKPAGPVSAVAKAEPPKPDTKPVEPVAGSSKTEPTKPESIKPEPTRIEPQKADAKAGGGGAKAADPVATVAKAEPPKPLDPAVDAKTEPPKSEPPKSEPPKSEPPKPAAARPTPVVKPPPVAPPPRRPGMAVPLLASIVCAAIVALGVAYAYQTITGQDQIVAALKAQIAGLQERLDAADKQVAALPRTSALTALEAGVDRKLGAADAARLRASEAAEQRLRKLETIRNEVTGALEKRVGSLEALTTTLGAQIDQASTKAEVVRIQAARAVEAVAKASATPPGAPIVLPPTVDVAPINARLEEVEAKLKSVEATLATPKTEARATEVRAVVASPKADPANLAIVAQALARAFEQGTPFAGEVATLEALGAGNKAGTLKPFADHGAPRFAELTAQFAVLRPAILAAAAPPSSGSFLDRLSSGASGLVSVRPTGEAAATGTSPAAVVGQIETALAHGDTAAAIAAWAKLPPPAQKVSQAWADRLKAREAAHQAAQALVTESIAALAKPKS